jgi:TolB-like protein/Tfp pilus assembly protein PilF
MAIWTTEIKEIEKLYESFKGQFPELEKELGQLIKTEDENVILLYSRRCLEIIIIDLCECELKRPRKTEPLKGIIDKLHKEEKVPAHIITSMHGLNDISTYGTHPKDFDPAQVKPVLNNLDIIIRWYLKYKETGKEIKIKPGEDIRHAIIRPGETKGVTWIKKKRLIWPLTGLIVITAIVAAVLFITKISGDIIPTKEIEKTIAVLPFRNLSNDTTQLYFCDGFMEEILNNLQAVKSLTVRSRTSSGQYRDTNKSVVIIGNELNANYLVEGSVGREGNNLKIWVQLIDSKADKHIWSNEYTREIKQIFSLQSEIARDIAAELRAILSPGEIEQIEKKPTENLEAYNYYLQGNFYYRKSFDVEDLRTANRLYGKAIELDPEFALAYTGTAYCLMNRYWFHQDRSEDILPKCKQSIDKAFEIDPDLPEAHLVLGIYYYMGFLNYPDALKQFEMVLKELPNNSEAIYWSGAVNRRAGNWKLAELCFVKAFELDPRSSRYADDAGEVFDLQRNYPKAEYYYNMSIMLQPGWIQPYVFLSQMFLRWQGDIKKARAVLEKGALNNSSFVSDSLFVESKVIIDIVEGKYEEAITDLSLTSHNAFQGQFYFKPKYLYYAAISGLMNKPDLEHAYYDSSRIMLEKMIIDFPKDQRLYSSLGISYAGLGLSNKAVSTNEKAVNLLPVSKEAWRGVYLVEDLAHTYVMVGKYPEALEKIAYLLSIPGFLSTKILEMDPKWKPVKNQPEFRNILEKYTIN